MTPAYRLQAAQSLRHITEDIQAQAVRLESGEDLQDIYHRLFALEIELRKTRQWVESEVLSRLGQKEPA